MTEPLIISCDTCTARHTDACSDCIVSFFCGDADSTQGAIVLDFEQQRALRVLAREGLMGEIRHTSAG
jgi:hypothetical protein